MFSFTLFPRDNHTNSLAKNRWTVKCYVMDGIQAYGRRNSLNIQLCKMNHFQRPTKIQEPEDWKAEVAAEKVTIIHH